MRGVKSCCWGNRKGFKDRDKEMRLSCTQNRERERPCTSSPLALVQSSLFPKDFLPEKEKGEVYYMAWHYKFDFLACSD
jgi:hypothetical protein